MTNKNITDLNAPVLLCSTTRHQTLDVNASISHIGVYSSLLAQNNYKEVISQCHRPQKTLETYTDSV